MRNLFIALMVICGAWFMGACDPVDLCEGVDCGDQLCLNGACVDCIADADCAEGERCNANNVCEADPCYGGGCGACDPVITITYTGQYGDVCADFPTLAYDATSAMTWIMTGGAPADPLNENIQDPGPGCYTIVPFDTTGALCSMAGPVYAYGPFSAYVCETFMGGVFTPAPITCP